MTGADSKAMADRATELVAFVNGRCSNEEAGRKCLGFFVQYGDAMIATLTSPHDDLHAHLLHMLGAKDHEDAGRIIGLLHGLTPPQADKARGETVHTTLYVDLDGVMADFDGAFPAVFGLDHRSLADDEMWTHINGHASFFRDLPPMAGAVDFFRSIEHLNPVILTACPKSNYAHVAAQKRAWVRAHLSTTCLVLPVMGGRHKPLFMHQPGDVLIDDWGKNCAAWDEAGGVAIKHEGDWDATRTALESAMATTPQPQGDASPDADVLRCMRCGLPYSDFAMDVTIPDDQWESVSGREDGSGVMCGTCIFDRLAKLPGATAIRAYADTGTPQVSGGGAVSMDDLATISRALKMFKALAWIGEVGTSVRLSFRRSPEEYRNRIASANRAMANISDLSEKSNRTTGELVEAPILKGIGKVNGDGWKDTTKPGDVVFVWNGEMADPHAPGQYLRVGNRCGWTASVQQYDFLPATAEEVRGLFDPIAALSTPQARPDGKTCCQAAGTYSCKCNTYPAPAPDVARLVEAAREVVGWDDDELRQEFSAAFADEVLELREAVNAFTAAQQDDNP